jgi:hypothetical protein
MCDELIARLKERAARQERSTPSEVLLREERDGAAANEQLSGAWLANARPQSPREV